MENFLKEIYAKDYMGCDDDMPCLFDNWIANLEPDEWIKYADAYKLEK